MAPCRECGKDLLPGAAFCDACGAAVPTPLAATPTPGPTAMTDVAEQPTAHLVPPAAPRGGFPLWVIAVIVVMIAVAGVAGVALFVTRDRESATVATEPGGAGQVASGVSSGSGGWVGQYSATDYTLKDVSFADATHGWAVGGSTDGSVGIILVTTDGGATWAVQDAGGGFATLNAVYAIDAQTCCAVGGNAYGNDITGVVLMTTDGGSSWSSQATDQALNDVTFIDASRGWCVGQCISANGQCSGVILATDDGGRNWDPTLHDDIGFFTGVSFVDASTGWVASDTPHGEPDPDSLAVYKTTDGGGTLTKQFEVYGYSPSIHFVDEEHGWMAGSRSNGVSELPTPGVWATDDGGESWVFHKIGGADVVYAISFTDALHGWAVGSGIWVTSDGGKTWTPQLLAGGPELFGVAFLGSTDGVAVGGSGAVLGTSDGGTGDGTPQSWDSISAPSSASPDDETLAYLKRLQQLIVQSRSGRQKLRAAISGFDSHRLSGSEAAAAMDDVISNRSSVLNQVRGVAVPDDAGARRCRAALIASMQASIGADKRYRAAMLGTGSEAAAAPFDRLAGSAKARFVRAYNALAAQYDLRSDWKVEDL